MAGPKTPEDADRNLKSESKSKFSIIFDTLKERITSGEYRLGERLPSEGELARWFGVSRMTVVRAVRDLQQLGLVTRRPGSGTYSAFNAEQGRAAFGLLIPDLGETEIFEPICQGMARYPLAGKYSLLWGHSPIETERAEEIAEHLCQQFISQKVSGVFFAPLELTPTKDQMNKKIAAAFDRAQIPLVLLDRCIYSYPRRSKYDLVGIDNRRTAYIATEHLMKCGAKKVAFFARQYSASTVEARIAGYREAVLNHRSSRDEDLVFCADPSDESFLESALNKYKIDAFLCANDRTAALLMHTLLRLNRRIPEDVRIVGIDDVKYASLLPIPLTTQHQPCLDIGAIAMSAMVQRLENPTLPTRDILLNCHLVIRRSCGMRSMTEPEEIAQS